MVIPFSKPSVGPQSEADSIAFNQIPTILKMATSAVGWAIYSGKQMKKDVGYIQGDLSERVRKRLCGIESRLTTGYTTLLYFAQKVLSM